MATSIQERVRAHLITLVDPLREQLAEIDARLDEVEVERASLRKTRVEIMQVIVNLDPAAAAAMNGKAPTVQLGNQLRAKKEFEAKVDWVEAWIKRNGHTVKDGVTANLLADTLRGQVPKGLSTASAIKVLDVLRDRGVVYADKVVRGGGMQFKVVGS